MKAVFDTNILIDYLNGFEQARKEISSYPVQLISPITWMEVMVGVKTDDENMVRSFLTRFTLVPVNENVAEKAVILRRDNRIRLPDAIIWATAQVENALLVSRNTKDFPVEEPDVRVPYQL